MDLNINLKEMNLDKAKNLNVDKSLILILYKKYKDYALPIGIIIISLIILFFVLIPEFGQYSASRAQLDTETQKRDILKNNYNLLTSLDQVKLESDLKLLTTALPSEKDFVGIITALSAASSKTGVSIGDFSFNVGSLAKEKNAGTEQFPQIKVDLDLQGSPQQISNFLSELYKTAPLSEIKSIKISSSIATIVLVFYYKPYPPQNISDSSPIVPMTSSNTKLLKDISGWNNVTAQDLNLIPTINIPSNATPSSTQTNTSPFD